MNAEWLEWFYAGALEISKTCGLLPADYQSPDGVPVKDQRLMTIVADFIEQVNSFDHFETPRAAADAFKAWAKRGFPAVKPLPQQTITCTLTRDLGGVQVTFGWSGLFDLTSPKQVMAAYDYAVDQCNRAFASFGAGALPKMGAPLQSSKPMSTFFADTIVTEIKEGKKYHKVLGGPYVKWGVRVWPETLKQAGIDHEALSAEEPYPLKRDVTITLDGDKPIKVVQIS